MSSRNLGNILILEGVDASGKSTLSEFFRKINPGIGVKVNDIPKDPSDEEHEKIKEHYRTMIKIVNENPQTNFSFDRFFPSEIVYGKIKRKRDWYKDGFFKGIERSVKGRVHLLVYCDPGVEVIKERLQARGDFYVGVEDVQKLYDEYDKFLSRTTLNVLRLDTNQPVEDLFKIVKKELDRYEYERNNQ